MLMNEKPITLEKIKPVIVPFKRRIFKNGQHSIKTRYVAYCGCCGNPILPFTSQRFCCFCHVNTDWDGAPYYKAFKIDENAIENTINRI